MMTFITKALLNTDTASDLGSDWAFSKRTILIINNESMDAGDEIILFSQIKDSKLRIVPSAYFIPGAILSISTDVTTHHFGLSYSKKLLSALPFVEQTEKASAPPMLWIRRIFNVALVGIMLYSVISAIWN